ncbi:TlpA disulfide reductase family protein [Limnobacter sp. 130]|jgi:thiol-disulfide isomerase/thioredoxin|uniref:TlpA disulfide reductase family protein n=1 Tax=unclassified Limnobacter TaxID=2630203 RepID=UPI0012F0A3E1|nr:TlpA disulfide reductase family protein [Limnobacter sp. 130]VWX37349.1 Alkyl hydroperoxide reductase [Limnobacter sp. 130]
MKNKLIPIVTAVLALAIGLYFGLKPQNGPDYPLTGYTFDTPQGGSLDLGALKGKVVVLNFWATWCPPCVEEMPELDELYPQLQAQNIELIGIAIDSPSNVDQFLQKTPVNYPIVLAGMAGTELGKALGNQQGGLPFTVILDENGNKILTEAGRIQMSTITNALQR